MELDLWQVALLIVVGIAGGFVNVLAGGGSLLTVPVMIFLGLPGPVANGTNRIGILAQSIVSIVTFTRRGFSRILGSPTSGAPTRSSSGTRYASASGSSSSRLGRRCPVSSRDRVLLEMPVEAATPVNVIPRSLRSCFNRGPTWSSAAAILAVASFTYQSQRRFPETATCVVESPTPEEA